MKIFRCLFLSIYCFCMMSLQAKADGIPTQVQDSLKSFYPEVEDVIWSKDLNYYVADFQTDGFETRMWFTAAGGWSMKQVDWGTLDEVPAEVYNAFVSSDYSDAEVLNVTWVVFARWQSLVVIEVGKPNLESKYQLFYTPQGELLRVRDVTNLYNILGASTFL